MKNIFVTIITALTVIVLLAACTISIHKVDTGKSGMKKTFDVSGDVSTIHIVSTYDVDYSVGDTLMVTAEGDEIALKNVKVSCQNGVLSIVSSANELKEDGGKIVWGNVYGTCKIHVTAPSVPTINVDGVGTFTCKDTISVDRFAAVVMGSGQININSVVCQQDAEMSIQGSGTLEIANIAAQHANYFIGGSGDIEAKQSKVPASMITINGSGDISVDNDDCGSIKTLIQGSGVIKLTGTAASVEKNIQGSGIIDTENLKTK